jgi:D-lactate dehydrogenase
MLEASVSKLDLHTRSALSESLPSDERERVWTTHSVAGQTGHMIQTVVFDTKPYDRDPLEKASSGSGIEWRFMEYRLSSETAATAQGAQAICIFVNDRADRPCLEELGALGIKHIALRCAGFNGVDIAAAKKLGLTVTRVPAYSPYAVAEHAIALLLALNRKIARANNRVRELNFSLSGLVGFDLHGKTAGVVGTGKIGRATAQILRGFGMRVLAFDLFPSEDWAREHGVEYTDPRTLARECDVISLHTPLTPETRYIIRSETLELMKPGAILVNVSRGALIETGALIQALKSGRLGGVALDVYEEEEGVFFEDLSGQILHDDVLARLLTFPNVLITAHQAFLTQEALSEIARVTVANLVAAAKGEPFLEGTELTANA